MKKLIFFIVVSLLITACVSTKNSVGNVQFASTMKNLYEQQYTKNQFDSICIADTLPQDFEKWHKINLKDFETNNVVKEYLYIKKLGENEIIYRVELITPNSYKITKRIKN